MPKRMRDEDLSESNAPPTEINPYDVLGIQQEASQDEIKKAYRKAALRHHPDKAAAEDKDAAHIKFQEVAFAFAILSDERRRKRYDTTGRTEESLDLDDDDFDWMTFFKEQFEGVVTEETINNFANEYKGGDEERQAVLDAYVKVKGKMPSLYDYVMLSDMVEDEERFRFIIDKAIDDGEVEAFARYTNESESARTKRIAAARKRKEREAKEADEAAEEIKEKNSSRTKGKKTKGDTGGMGDLAALIQQRQKGRAENFFDDLEARYAPKAKKSKKGIVEEPPEEAFAANRTKSANGPESEGNRKSKRAKQA